MLPIGTYSILSYIGIMIFNAIVLELIDKLYLIGKKG